MDNQTLVELYDSVVEDEEYYLSLRSEMAASATVIYFHCLIMVPYSVVPWYEERHYEIYYKLAAVPRTKQRWRESSAGIIPSTRTG